MSVRLGVITPDATPEEVAAILAAVTVLRARSVEIDERDDTLHEWVRVARLQARRSGRRRGQWRLSGRVGRRPRT